MTYERLSSLQCRILAWLVAEAQRTINCWESTVTPPPGKTRQWEGYCR
jgi:hypothetical protein